MNTFDKLNNAANRMGETNDCSVKALATVCSISYSKAHALMAKHGRKPRQGAHTWQTLQAVTEMGFEVEVIKNPKYKTINQFEQALKAGKIRGAWLVHVCRHIAGAKRGVLADWTSMDNRGKGSRHRIDFLIRVYKPRKSA